MKVFDDSILRPALFIVALWVSMFVTIGGLILLDKVG